MTTQVRRSRVIRVRRHRRGDDAQAVLEMALVLVIFVTMVALFLSIMVEVRTRAEVQAALSLATQSSISAPVNDPADSCNFAAISFYDTLYGFPQSGGIQPTKSCSYGTSPGTPDISVTFGATPANSPLSIVGGHSLECNGSQYAAGNDPAPTSLGYTNPSGGNVVKGSTGVADYYHGTNYPITTAYDTGPPVVCNVRVKLDFSKTPLSFVFPLGSGVRTFDVSSIAVPTKVRQCGSSSCPTS